jgi:hypothetical protein
MSITDNSEADFRFPVDWQVLPQFVQRVRGCSQGAADEIHPRQGGGPSEAAAVSDFARVAHAQMFSG